MRQHRKYWVYRFSVALLALILLVCMATPAYAVDMANGLTVANGETLSLTRDNPSYGGGSASGNTITISASGYKSIGIFSKTSTTTLTITNVDEKERAITIAYSTFTTSNTTPEEGSVELSIGESTTFSITSPSGSGTYTKTIIIDSITFSGSAASTVTFLKPTAGGNYTATANSDGTTKYSSSTATANSTAVPSTEDTFFTLTATATSGWKFSHWVDGSGKTISRDNPYTNFQCLTQTVQPVFFPSGNATYFIAGTPNVLYGYLDQAITAAGNSGTIVVATNGNVAHSNGTTTSFTIPAGVSLLIPYNDGDLVIQAGDADAAYANYQAYTSRARPKGMPLQDVYRTLTIPSGTTVTLLGTATAPAKVVVGGILAAGEGDNLREGGTYGNHGNLVVNGNLKLADYSILSTCGYVIGDGKVETTGTGAAIYQPMVINDWRGAAYASLATNNTTGLNALYHTDSPFPSGEATVSPFSQWGFINIRTDIKLTEGNTMGAYCSLLEDSTLYTTTSDIVSSAGLLQLSDNAYLTSEWQELWILTTDGKTSSDLYPLTGQNKITIYGGASVGVLSLTVANVGDFSSADFTLPICYNFDLTLSALEGVGSTYTIGQNMVLMPGAGITVDDGATLNITASRFVVLDGLTSQFMKSDLMDMNLLDGVSYTALQLSFVANTRTDSKCYPTAFELRDGGLTSNAKFIVNGTLSIGASTAFGGLIQSTQAGATISVGGSDKSIVSGSVMCGLTDRDYVNAHGRVRVGGSCHTLTASILAADGSMITLQRGRAYVSSVGSSYLTEYTADYYYGITSSGALDSDYTFMNQVITLISDTYTEGQPIYGTWGCKHTYETGSAICKYCALFEFYASNVHLGNNLNMMFAFPKAGLSGMTADELKACYVEIVRTYSLDKDGNIKATETTSVPISEWYTYDEDYYVVVYSGFAAKEMCDTITLTVYKGGNVAISVSLTDSLRAYCLRMLTESTNDLQKTLIKDMLNYGAACQNYFQYGTNQPLANADLGNYPGTASGDLTLGEGSQVSWGESQLVTDSNISFRLSFADATIENATHYSYTFKGHKGNEVTREKTAISQVITIEELVVADADCTIEVTIYYEDGMTTSFEESIAEYIMRMNTSTADPVYTEFLKFARSSYAYKHPNTEAAT